MTNQQKQYIALWVLFEKYPDTLIDLAKHGTNVDLVQLYKLKEGKADENTNSV